MKRFTALVIAIILALCLVPSMAESSGLDFSNLSDEQLQRLIDAAQAEMDARQAAATEQAPAAQESAADDLEEALAAQPVYISAARLSVQSPEYKALYPDLLQAVIVNNSEDDLKNVTVAFAAWDANNLPVLLKGQMDFEGAAYIKRGNYNGINLVPGGSFGEKTGLGLDQSVTGIVTVKAMVVSYETFDGTKWENPLYNEFKEKYEGKKLQ